MELLAVILAVLGLAGGTAIGYIYRKKLVEEKNKDLTEKSAQMLRDAQNKSKETLLEAKNNAFKVLDEAKRDERRKREQLQKIEERLVEKEQFLDKKSEEADKLKEELENKVTSVKRLREEVEKIQAMQQSELEKVAQMSKEEAKEILLKKVEEDTKEILVEQIKKTEQQVKDEADKRAKYIIAEAIQKYAAETTAESTATIVTLPSDDMKGRIIGREGRNINTFEEITGIDVIVDDTPGSIVISGFDLVRRYIAKVTLERLIADGRIHPARIEETYEKVKEEVNQLIKELGEKAAFEVGVAGLHPNLVKLLGRLKFRVSYGQNVLKHSMEVAFLAANLASELGADVNLCKRAGLLHDIGKAVDHEIQGNHAAIGRDIAKKFGLSEDIVHCIEAHHGLVEPKTVEALVIAAANAIANSRPGADKENLDNYIKRLEELENVCNSFPGVKKSYAIQAGTEVRIFVNPTDVDDLGAVKMSHDIARKIEKDMQYPGQVKVNVIRETRTEEFAK
ncbi:ribonuclease Y [Candidatus Peregrinibacteria bacterium]|nr:ribonuclease Y [Candidatus Peregrinibacteria bacterium]